MSPRPSHESDVIRMVVQGFDNPQIASRLGLSLGRVKNIVTGILAKHGVSDRKELRRMLETL
jgi:DNA-binding NarL/FixJ family response regulator